MSERGESDYVRRIQKEGVETAEEEAYFFESVLAQSNLDDLFYQARDEVKAF